MAAFDEKTARERFSSASTGAAIGTTTAEWKLLQDDSSLGSDSTDADGFAELALQSTSTLLPAPHYVELTSSGKTRQVHSLVTGVVGRLSLTDLVFVLKGLGDGVVDDVLSECAVSAPGGMVARVASGAGLVNGSPFRSTANVDLTLSNGDATHPRIDTVVVRVYMDSVDYGKVVIAALEGTPAASPVAPTLTQSLTTVWEMALANVAVAAGASSISSGNLTDRREIFPKLSDIQPSASPTFTGTLTAEDVAVTDDLTVGDDATITGSLAAADVTATTTVTAADLIATDDLTVGDDAAITGDLTAANVTASATVTGADLVATDDLTVTGDATVGGTLDVTGATTLDSTLAVAGNMTAAACQFSGNISAGDITAADDVNVTDDLIFLSGTSHLRGQSTGPSIAAGAAAGSSPTVSVSGNDAWGQVAVTVGTSPTTGILCTITLGEGFSSQNWDVQLTPKEPDACRAVARVHPTIPSSGTWRIDVIDSALSASTSYAWAYLVTERDLP